LQFAFMYGGFLLLLPIAVVEAGGFAVLPERLPEVSFEPLGGQSLGYVIAWYFIALQTLVEPTFFQRCFAARSPAVARRGLIWSILFFALFDGLTTFTGMYARALLPDIPSGVDAFPALGELLLPAGLLGVFYAGMIATVMSTVDAFLFNAGITLSRDLLARAGRAAAATVRGERVGLVAGAVVATSFALASTSVVDLWYGFGTVGTSVLLAPVLGVFFPALRPTPRWAAAGMVAGGCVAGAGIVAARGASGPWLGVEPIFLGLATSAVAATAGILARRAASRRAA
jgi:SSS family solute:Na+ symporter